MLFHANAFPSLKQCFFHSGKKEHGTCTPIVCPSMPVQTSLLYPQSVSLKVCLLKFKNMTIKIQNSKTWPSKTWPSNCISQSMSLTIQKHDPQNSKFKNMTFKNMTLKVYLSKYYCISQKFSKYVPKNSKHDHHNLKTWPSKCVPQSNYIQCTRPYPNLATPQLMRWGIIVLILSGSRGPCQGQDWPEIRLLGAR